MAFPSVPEARFDKAPDAHQLEVFRVLGSEDAWLMDGGVLDNAPFGPVLDEIARTPVDTPRRRALVYLVPSVDESEEGSQASEGPGWQRVLSTALFLLRTARSRSNGNNAVVADLADFLTKVLARSMPPDMTGGPVRTLAGMLGVRRRLVKALRKPTHAGGGPPVRASADERWRSWKPGRCRRSSTSPGDPAQ